MWNPDTINQVVQDDENDGDPDEDLDMFRVAGFCAKLCCITPNKLLPSIKINAKNGVMIREKNPKVFQYSGYHFSKESEGQSGSLFKLHIDNDTDSKCVIYYYDRNRQKCAITEI